MNLLIVLIIVLVIFGGGNYYTNWAYAPHSLIGIILLLVILRFLGVI